MSSQQDHGNYNIGITVKRHHCIHYNRTYQNTSEVAQVAQIHWVQPKVLDMKQIDGMRNRLKDWDAGQQDHGNYNIGITVKRHHCIHYNRTYQNTSEIRLIITNQNQNNPIRN
jgi:uncharacterized Fe-S cluster protein YjdI